MDSPPPDLLSWAFWFKDSASVRDLLLALAAPVAFITAIAAFRQASIAGKRHVEQTNSDRERRITDSFTKAVELLGRPELEVRLGAIYALERIARESKHDHWSIMETLTAYVRTKSPAQVKAFVASRLDQGHPSDDAVSAYAVAAAEGTTEAAQGTTQASHTELAVDIQAVLTVLVRRAVEHEEENQLIDLSGTNLSGGRLSGADLTGADLTGADLSEAKLIKTKLKEARLIGIDFSRASLRQADLSGANLIRANLTGVYMSGINLSGAFLVMADLSGAKLSEANLIEADLRHANLSGADLSRADLDTAKFCQTTMPDGTVNNQDCPPEPAPPSSSETAPAPN